MMFSDKVSEYSTVSAFLELWNAAIMASAVAVVPSYMEALAMSMPVSSAIMLWNSKM